MKTFVKFLKPTFLRSQLCSGRYLSSSTSSSSEGELVVETLTGSHEGIVVLGLNRPASRNAIGRQLANSLIEAIEDLKYKTHLRVMIFRSHVPGTFCAGADLKERATMPQGEVAQFVGNLRNCLSETQKFPFPTIAAMDGTALGGGLEMALCNDMRIASSNAKMGLVETKLAIIPGAGGTQNLSRVVGTSKAKELIFTGRILNGNQAHDIGLVNYVVDQNENGDAAYQKALELAAEIIPQGPVALRMAKQAINMGSEVDLATGLAFEQACYAQVIPTKDRMEGLTAFKEKRKPKYEGR